MVKSRVPNGKFKNYFQFTGPINLKKKLKVKDLPVDVPDKLLPTFFMPAKTWKLLEHGINCQPLPHGKLNIAMRTVDFSAINTISYLTLFPMYEILTSPER